MQIRFYMQGDQIVQGQYTSTYQKGKNQHARHARKKTARSEYCKGQSARTRRREEPAHGAAARKNSLSAHACALSRSATYAAHTSQQVAYKRQPHQIKEFHQTLKGKKVYLFGTKRYQNSKKETKRRKTRKHSEQQAKSYFAYLKLEKDLEIGKSRFRIPRRIPKIQNS